MSDQFANLQADERPRARGNADIPVNLPEIKLAKILANFQKADIPQNFEEFGKRRAAWWDFLKILRK